MLVTPALQNTQHFDENILFLAIFISLINYDKLHSKMGNL